MLTIDDIKKTIAEVAPEYKLYCNFADVDFPETSLGGYMGLDR